MDQTLPGLPGPQTMNEKNDDTGQPPSYTLGTAPMVHSQGPSQQCPYPTNPSIGQGYVNLGYETSPQIGTSSPTCTNVHNVTVVQPEQRALQAIVLSGNDVPDYLASSIMNMICFCMCLGIAAIVYSSRANSLRYTDPVRARQLALTARNLNIAGFVICSIALLVFFIVLFVVIL